MPAPKSSTNFSVNATPKWAVLDAPGVSQPDWATDTDHTSTTTPSTSNQQQQPNKAGAQGRRAKEGKGPKMASNNKVGGDSFVQRTANPSWLATRNQVYQQIQQRRNEEQQKKSPVPISVTLPDGKVLTLDGKEQPFQSYRTTPYDVAVTISQGLADAATVARVTYANFCEDYSLAEDGMEGEDTLLIDESSNALPSDQQEGDSTKHTHLWDMTRPLVGNVSKLEFLKFEQDKDAKTVFWHSSAHIMGEALEHLYGCKLTIGPPLAGGFYYDSYMGTEALKEDDCEFNVSACMNG
jgi:threonyl-tRNA synthetase